MKKKAYNLFRIIQYKTGGFFLPIKMTFIQILQYITIRIIYLYIRLPISINFRLFIPRTLVTMSTRWPFKCWLLTYVQRRSRKTEGALLHRFTAQYKTGYKSTNQEIKCIISWDKTLTINHILTDRGKTPYVAYRPIFIIVF